MVVSENWQDREHYKFANDNEAPVGGSIVNLVLNGGLVYSGTSVYSNGDAAMMNFDTSGRLKCILDGATFVFSGANLEVDVSAFRTTGSARRDALVFTQDENISGLGVYWQGVGGYDETALVFRALPLATDDAAMPASPQILPIGGEYRATPAIYSDGDAVELLTDRNGKLVTFTDGVFTSGTNSISSTVGLIAHDNATTPNASGAIVRLTGGSGTSAITQNTAFGLDTRSLTYAYSGTQYNPVIATPVLSQFALATGVLDISGNRLPAMDTTARAGFQILTNGSIDYTILPSNAAAQPTNVIGVAGEIADFDTSGAADLTAAIGVLGASNSGAVPLRLDADGNLQVDVDGYYVLASNPNPDSVGLIAAQNAASPAESDEIVRLTAGSGNSPTISSPAFYGLDTRSKIYATQAGATMAELQAAQISTTPTYGLSTAVIDVSGNRLPAMDVKARAGFQILTNGSIDYTILPTNAAAQPTNVIGVAGEVVDFDTSAGATDFTSAMGVLVASNSGAVPLLGDATGALSVAVDGEYIVATNPVPDSVGLIAHINAVSPSAIGQKVRLTAGSVDIAGVWNDTIFGLDTRSTMFGRSGGMVFPLEAIKVSGASYGLGTGIFDGLGNRLNVAVSGTATTNGITILGRDISGLSTYFSAVGDSDAVVAGEKGVIAHGSDGSNYYAINTDSAGRVFTSLYTQPGSLFTLRWTGSTAISNGVSPGTDTAIDLEGAKSVYIETYTGSATTGTPNFDFHLLSSADGTNYTTSYYTTVQTAQAIATRLPFNLTAGPKSIKGRLDINAAYLASGEYVDMNVYVVR